MRICCCCCFFREKSNMVGWSFGSIEAIIIIIYENRDQTFFFLVDNQPTSQTRPRKQMLRKIYVQKTKKLAEFLWKNFFFLVWKLNYKTKQKNFCFKIREMFKSFFKIVPSFFLQITIVIFFPFWFDKIFFVKLKLKFSIRFAWTNLNMKWNWEFEFFWSKVTVNINQKQDWLIDLHQ